MYNTIIYSLLCPFLWWLYVATIMAISSYYKTSTTSFILLRLRVFSNEVLKQVISTIWNIGDNLFNCLWVSKLWKLQKRNMLKETLRKYHVRIKELCGLFIEWRGNIHIESASMLNLPQSLVSVMNFDKLLPHVLRRVARISLKWKLLWTLCADDESLKALEINTH